MKDFKDKAVRAGWIAGLFLAGSLLWLLSAGPRENALKRQVNAVLLSRGEDFKLAAPLRRRRGGIPLGVEFALEEPGVPETGNPARRSFLVFPLVSGGAVLSCGALSDSQGRVERLIPLGAHGEQAFERVPRGVLDVYIRRIEGEKKR